MVASGGWDFFLEALPNGTAAEEVDSCLSSTMLTRKGQDILALGALMATLAVASAVAMATISVSQRMLDPLEGSSPYGYTLSLALFVLPCIVFGIWVARSARTAEQRRAFLITIAALVPLGFILDIFFGRLFLRFPNIGATLGILVPGYDPRTGWEGLSGAGWEPVLPLEEFAFYALGFVAMLLVYVWSDEILFRSSKVDDAQRTPRVFRGWAVTLLFWLLLGGVLFAIAWLIRAGTPSESGEAFPGYFLFLLAASIIPSLFCSRIAFQFINWRALSLAWLFILAISQFWEGSLAMPYGWWAYNPDQMMGIFVRPLCDLPLEAVLVWTLGSWTTVIVYETILTALHAGRTGRSLAGVVRAPEAELTAVKRRLAREGREKGAPVR